MKRQLIAVVLGSLFALPAFANYELYGNGVAPGAQSSGKTVEQVRAELIAAQRAGQVVINAELGTMARDPAQVEGKTREQVRAEIVREQQSGRWFILGLRG